MAAILQPRLPTSIPPYVYSRKEKSVFLLKTQPNFGGLIFFGGVGRGKKYHFLPPSYLASCKAVGIYLPSYPRCQGNCPFTIWYRLRVFQTTA